MAGNTYETIQPTRTDEINNPTYYLKKQITFVDIQRRDSIPAIMTKKVQDEFDDLKIDIKPCLAGKMGDIEINSNSLQSLLKWLFICLIRCVVNVVIGWPFIIIFMIIYLLNLILKIRKREEYIKSKDNIILRLTSMVLLSISLFYWHFWSFISLFYLKQFWYGDVIKTFFMELSFEFILPRIVSIITYNSNKIQKYHNGSTKSIENDNDTHIILEIYKADLFKIKEYFKNKTGYFCDKIWKFFPHKYSHELIDYTYFAYAKLYFKTDTDEIINAVHLAQYCSRNSIKSFSYVSHFLLALLILGGISITWWIYDVIKYKYPIDLIIFCVWFVYFTYLLWSYFEIHLYSQFFIYLNQMRILNEIININFDELLNKFINDNELYPNANEVKKGDRSDSIILFLDHHNIRAWFDIWSEIRRNSRDYFDKQKFFIITVFILLIFSVIWGTIRLFTDWFDFGKDLQDIHITFFGAPAIIYSVLSGFMLLTLLYLSFQFPKIQKYQIRSLTDQYYYINDINTQITFEHWNNDDETIKSKLNNLIIHLTQIQKHLKTIIHSIQIKKVRPTIAGLSMDHFLLRLVSAGIIFIIGTVLSQVITF